MNTIAQDLKNSAASVLKDPFNKKCMVGFSTYCSLDYKGAWSYRGRVSFKNGDTEAEQQFNAKSLSELLLKMQAFVETLEGQNG